MNWAELLVYGGLSVFFFVSFLIMAHGLFKTYYEIFVEKR